jgi:phage-related protein
LMCFFHGRNVVITHGFTKKKDRLPRKELERGQRIRETFLASQRR